MLRSSALLLCAVPLACAPGQATSQAPQTAATPAGSSVPFAPAAQAPAENGAAPPTAPSAAAAAMGPTATTPRLPELSVTNIGLHIGGGPNDAETKAPYQAAIARRFPEFMDCYRLVEEPGKGGVFGVDLHIPRQGGAPRVAEPRTKIRGEKFSSCVAQVFERVAFERQKRGPTTISYSLRFDIAESPPPKR